MDDKNTCFHVFLLLNITAVSSYLQFVVPGVTQADSSPIHISGGVYPFLANRTVDGNFSQNIRACLHTADRKNITEAWLRIDLQTVRSIKSVKFWYRNDRGFAAFNTARLRGYSIRVSNSSNIAAVLTDACYTDNSSSTLQTIIQNECERTARYVWFYQPHVRESYAPILEICEVQIFGCDTGKHDFSCFKTCSHCKNNETCDIDTGKCDDNGCALPVFVSPMCSECISGMYDKECNLKCSQFCQKKSCHQTSGECVYGCEDGYIGGLCTIPCPNSNFGRKCLETCGKCLDDQTCDSVNGTCLGGCHEGFKGELCKIACSPGEYGRNCQFRCSEQCYDNEVCDPFFGNCSKCADGFKSAKCDEQCDGGHYGESCMFPCGHCLSSVTCNNINGSCPDGCMSGWQTTDKCDKPCGNGTFGVGCIDTCSGNCLNKETCDKSDGGCRNCATGWEGHLCNKSCDIGQYGVNCQHTCGHCYKAKQCFHTNGSCSGGCMEEYRGEMCSESVLRSTQGSDTPYVAVITVLVVVIIVLVTVLAVGAVVLRNTRKKLETNSQINEAEMYDLPNAKPESSLYDIISNQ